MGLTLGMREVVGLGIWENWKLRLVVATNFLSRSPLMAVPSVDYGFSGNRFGQNSNWSVD